jgi:hypothetical protein
MSDIAGLFGQRVIDLVFLVEVVFAPDLAVQATGQPEEGIRAALLEEGMLIASGIVSFEQGACDLENKISSNIATLLLVWKQSLQTVGQWPLTMMLKPND